MKFGTVEIILFFSIKVLLVLLCPSVLQTNSLVEHGVLGCRVEVCHEVADALELQILSRLAVGSVVLNVAVLDSFEALRVEQFAEVALVSRRVLNAEQTVVNAHLSLVAVVGRYPVECALHLAVGALKAALADRVVLSLNFDDVALSILSAASALHDVGVLQTYLLARSHAEEFFRSILHEVVALDPKIAREA